MTKVGAGLDTPTKESGITDEDMERIASYLKKPLYERSPDDLRRSSKE